MITAPSDIVAQQVMAAGAFRCGFAEAVPVSDDDTRRLADWIGGKHHAGMEWMERKGDIRRDPRLLLDGAKTLIVTLFNYHTAGDNSDAPAPRIAAYAHGKDYHYVLRERLAQVTDFLISNYGGECRVCIDSAPLRERYWAQRAGLGYCGRNGMLIVPGVGSSFFIATILWTGKVSEYTRPYDGPGCGSCHRCVDACPRQALSGDGTVDCRRCLSYLTIESREELPCDFNPHGNLFGCDACRLACPHSHNTPLTEIEEFAVPHPATTLSLDQWLATGTSAFRRITSGSPLSRVRLSRLKEVALRLKTDFDTGNTLN